MDREIAIRRKKTTLLIVGNIANISYCSIGEEIKIVGITWFNINRGGQVAFIEYGQGKSNKTRKGSKGNISKLKEWVKSRFEGSTRVYREALCRDRAKQREACKLKAYNSRERNRLIKPNHKTHYTDQPTN